MTQPSAPINVLLVGGGGREHALAASIARSPMLGKLWITHPQNPGLAKLGTPVDVPVDIKQIYRLQQFNDREDIGLVVVGPEEPLAQGFADKLSTTQAGRSVPVFGPTADGARLEADKAYAKHLMRAASIPTAEARVFSNADMAEEYVSTREDPPVVKAAGLAKGKGVIVTETIEEAVEAVDSIMRRRIFGDAGSTVIIEERLTGLELSVLALVDGHNIMLLPACQDHKRLGDGGTGPNTGGMGAFCPAPAADDDLISIIEREIIIPIVDALRRDGVEYRGVLYAGLMLTPAGPKVLEFNVRFGDPECQPLMALLESDAIEFMLATAIGRLDRATVKFADNTSAVSVVLASEGYPKAPITGRVITGIDRAEALDRVEVFHAGTERRGDDIVTAGGRVLCVTATGDTMAAARTRAYAACDVIEFQGKTLRTDIAATAAQPA